MAACNSSDEQTTTIQGDWEAFQLTSSGNAVPEYLVEDFTLEFAEDGQYKGALEWLQLANEGQYTLIEDKLILGKDTLLVKKNVEDTLFLFYDSYSVPFEIKLTTKK